MQLDPVTLSLSLTLTYVVAGLVAATLWATAPADRALLVWAVGYVAAALGVVVLGAETRLHDTGLLIAGNMLLAGGAITVWQGLRVFFGRPLSWRWCAFLLGAFTLGFAALVAADTGLRPRVMLFSSTIAVVSLLAIRDTLIDRTPGLRAGRIIAALGFSAYAVTSAYRVATAIAGAVAAPPFAGDGATMSAVFVAPMAGNLIGSYGLFLLAHQRTLAEMAFGAAHDALTHALNRRALNEQAGVLMRLATRHRFPVTCLMVDIDHFKLINDTYGHAAGDAVIVAVVEVIRRCLREGDLLARYGGEEFCIVCPHADVAGARVVAERIRAAIAAEPPIPPLRSPVTVSVGAAIAMPVDLDGSSLEILANQADAALYLAKRGGRNRTEVREPA